MASMKEQLAALRAELEALVPDNSKKLTANDVRQLRSDYRTGNFTQAQLAKSWDLNPATVSRIVRGIYHSRIR